MKQTYEEVWSELYLRMKRQLSSGSEINLERFDINDIYLNLCSELEEALNEE